jgi:predicted nicotinamide N-methyase
MPRYFSDEEIDRLRLLRSVFVSFETRAGGAEPYWESDEALALYDETYAQRIAWKWDAVLEELRRRGRLVRGRTVLDWGCGTGIAARRFLAAEGGAERVHLWDHAPAALEFARERLEKEHPGVDVRIGLPEEPVDVLLASHVLDELDETQLEPLLGLAAAAAAVVWVEPGSRRTSRHLGELRARLLAFHDVLAPCTHQAACGALGSEDGWCHFFARPPQEVYTEGKWSELGRELGIDLRSLPYSFLALARRGAFTLDGPRARLLARPRLTRGRAEFELCDASGVARVDFLQRTDKRVFKALDDVAGEAWLFDATVEGRRVTALTRRDS